MDIRSVMTQVAVIQEAIEITEPKKVRVRKAHRYFPPQSKGMPTTPCFINEWTLDRENRITNGMRSQMYIVHMQLLVYDADSDKAADVASAFMPAIVDAFDATESLNGTCFRSKLRGSGGNGLGRPTLFFTSWANRRHAGLDLFLDVELTEGKTFGR